MKTYKKVSKRIGTVMNSKKVKRLGPGKVWLTVDNRTKKLVYRVYLGLKAVERSTSFSTAHSTYSHMD